MTCLERRGLRHRHRPRGGQKRHRAGASAPPPRQLAAAPGAPAKPPSAQCSEEARRGVSLTRPGAPSLRAGHPRVRFRRAAPAGWPRCARTAVPRARSPRHALVCPPSRPLPKTGLPAPHCRRWGPQAQLHEPPSTPTQAPPCRSALGGPTGRRPGRLGPCAHWPQSQGPEGAAWPAPTRRRAEGTGGGTSCSPPTRAHAAAASGGRWPAGQRGERGSPTGTTPGHGSS